MAKPKAKSSSALRKIKPPSMPMKTEASDALKGKASKKEDESVGGRVLGEGARKRKPK
jgi:hypothetical protein